MDTLRSDAGKSENGDLQQRTFFPPQVTDNGQRKSCCTVAFCKLYGISSKTKCLYWKIVVDGAEVEQLEQHELNLAKNEGQLGNIYLALLGDTDICERPVVIQRGSHELISEYDAQEYPKHRKRGPSENKRKFVAETTNAHLFHADHHISCAQTHGQRLPKSNVGSKTYGPSSV